MTKSISPYFSTEPEILKYQEASHKDRGEFLQNLAKEKLHRKILIVTVAALGILAVSFAILATLVFLRQLPIEPLLAQLPLACTYATLSLASMALFSTGVNLLSKWERIVDRSNLLLGTRTIDRSMEEWYLNAALLQDCYEATDDPELKEQIAFLGNNYLGKAAALSEQQTLVERVLGGEELISQTDHHTSSGYYHRETCEQQSEEVKKINKHLAMENRSPLILTDTEQCDLLFPLGFCVTQVNELDEASLAASICQAYQMNFPNGAPREDVKNFAKSILLDATEYFRDCIKTESEESKRRFEAKYRAFKKYVIRALKKAAKNLHASSDIDEKKFMRLCGKNVTAICRLKLGKIGGIKVLPVLASLEGSNFKKNGARICHFISRTGLYIGAVNYRKYVLKDFELSARVKYIHSGESGLIYATPQSFLQLETFSEMQQIVGSPEQPKYVGVLGGAVVNLLRGLMGELTKNDTWTKLMGNPQKKAIIQTALFKIQQKLAMARFFVRDYNQFTRSIELIHCELATLLAVTEPFKETDFPSILKTTLETSLPKWVSPLMKCGMTKAAMNTFAGVNKAVYDANPNFIRVYTKDCYFENVDFLGKTKDFNEAIEDPSVTHIDIYDGIFNPNISVETDQTHYKESDIALDIKKILKKNGNTPFTVVVDSTIDYIHSKKNAALLDEFKSEISTGKINFVFLRSGQKYDMFGNDDYYGSPFYFVNNGARHWDSFKCLLKDPTFKTDTLSLQWFCLAYKYATHRIDAYAGQVFKNTRTLLNRVPEKLKPQADRKQKVRVNTMDVKISPAFVDIKVIGPLHYTRAVYYFIRFYKMLYQRKIKAQTRGSFGFYHPNINIIRSHAVSQSSTIRINIGLNEKDIETLLEYLNVLT